MSKNVARVKTQLKRTERRRKEKVCVCGGGGKRDGDVEGVRVCECKRITARGRQKKQYGAHNGERNVTIMIML